MSRPLTSVIIPCYNAARFLPEAVASVRAQDWAPLEILVVDDGSTDDSAEVARRLEGLRLIQKPNGGAASARNFGLREARGERAPDKPERRPARQTPAHGVPPCGSWRGRAERAGGAPGRLSHRRATGLSRRRPAGTTPPGR